MRPIRKIIEDYEWIHTWVGVAGNVLFFTGSVLFLWESTKHTGTWMFIVGSAFMLVGSVGSALVKLQRDRRDAVIADQTVPPRDDAQLSLQYAEHR